MNLRATTGLPLAALLLATLLVATGCGKTPMEQLVPNQPPRIELSAGPIHHQNSRSVITFFWQAFDPDGRVVGARFAVDDTTGAQNWFETDDYQTTLSLTVGDSTTLDTLYVCVDTVRLVQHGMHTFYVKAIDDDGAESPPAMMSFTVDTIVPETQILDPYPHTYIDLGPSFTVSWEGYDPDAPMGVEGPVGYSWRVVKLPITVSIRALNDRELERELYDPESDGAPWSPFEARTSIHLENLEAGEHVFAVRAMDQAGAVEWWLTSFRTPGVFPNMLLIQASVSGGQPVLRVDTPTRPIHFPCDDGQEKTLQIPANQSVTFAWEGDASSYGGRVTGYSYGVDLDSLEENDPGWAGESDDLTTVHLMFTLPTGAPAAEHMLHIRVRDSVGTTLIADLHLVVIGARGDRDVLYVDDWGRDHRGREYPDIGPACRSAAEGGLIPVDSVELATGGHAAGRVVDGRRCGGPALQRPRPGSAHDVRLSVLLFSDRPAGGDADGREPMAA